MGIKISDLKNCLSKSEIGFLIDHVHDKYINYRNFLNECFLSNNDVPVDFFDDFISILYKYSEDKNNILSRDYALAILDKLNGLRDNYFDNLEAKKEQEEEPQEEDQQEQANEEDELSSLKLSYSIRYYVTAYYEDGHSDHNQFIGCADGLVFNFRENNLTFEGYRSVFNMFNFPESEKIVACDLSYELFEDFPF